MADKEWLTQSEIAEMLNVPIRKVYDATAALRKINAIRTTPDPKDFRVTLINAADLDIIKQFLRI